jgi:GNAT superfamily N-acetyltransferase
VADSAIDIYSDAFVAPGCHELDSRLEVQTAPGVRGVATIRLLVTDDSAYDRLASHLTGPWHGVVFVFDRATRCDDFMRAQPGWSGHAEMAMVLRDIQALTDAPLPDGLVVRAVDRTASPAANGVALREALRVTIESDPNVDEPVDKAAQFFDALPPSSQLFAAVDEHGNVHATSACHVFGPYAHIFFVSTEPGWQRRGIGRAMTVAALQAAGAAGAKTALLNATDAGAPVYKRLGFEEAGMLTRYSRDLVAR